MTKNRPASANQLSLLDGTISPPSTTSFAWDGRLRALLAGAIKGSRYSREEIALRMREATNETVSRAMLDAWTARSKPHRFPLSLLPAFCHATENMDLIKDALAILGARLATREDVAFAEVGRLHVQGLRTQERERALRVLLEDRS
jgi:hypothetical protein